MTKQQARGGSSTRQTILVLFLLIAGAGCIYEFSFARPQFQAAWEKIKTVDSSADSGEYTSDKIREMMGRDPISENHEQHDDCVVQTFRWKSGLLVKNHDIHVVYTKNKSVLSKHSDLNDKLYYFSASAGQPLDSDKNFPLEQETININLNPPAISMGGGAPQKGKSDPGDRKKEEKKSDKKDPDKDADKKDADKKPQDKDADKKDADKKPQDEDADKKDADKKPQDKDADMKDEDGKEGEDSKPAEKPSDEDKDAESGDEDKDATDDKDGKSGDEDKSDADEKSDDGKKTEKPESDKSDKDKKESGPDKS